MFDLIRSGYIYLFLFLFLWMLSFSSMRFMDKRQVFVVYIVCCFVLWFFCSFRFQTGFDWPAYESYYADIDGGSLTLEPAFVFIMRFFNYCELDYIYFQVFIATLFCSISFYVIYKLFGRYALFGLSVFYSIPELYLLGSFSTIRQGVAAAFFSLAMVYKNNLVLFFLVAISVSFHISGIMALIFWLVVYFLGRDASRVLSCVFFVFFIIQFDFSRTLLIYIMSFIGENKFSEYLVLDNAKFRPVVLLLYIFFMVAFFIFSDPNKMSSRFASFYYVYFLSFLIFFGIQTISSRISAMFVLFAITAMLCSVFKDKTKRGFFLLIVFMYSSFLFFRFMISPNTITYMPYQSYFSTENDQVDAIFRQSIVLDNLKESIK
jgi:hypothetical protein